MSFIKISTSNKEPNPASKYHLIGILIGIIGFISGYFGNKSNNVFLLTMFLVSLIMGIMIMTYGQTKFKFKGDKSYQEFIRKSSKRDLILLPSFMIILILTLVSYALFKSLIIAGVIFSIGVLIIMYMLVTFGKSLFKSWNAVKSEYNKLNKK